MLIPGPTIEHHGSISVPYEISIPKSEITSWPCPDQDCGVDDYDETAPRTKPQTSSRAESASSQLCSQRSSVSLQSPYTSSVDCNDTESGFESSSSSTTTTTVTSWRRQRQSSHPHEDGLTDLKNLTVRSTWKTRGVSSGEDSAQGRGDARAVSDCVFEDEAENSAMWRAYRATTTDAEDMLNSGKNPEAQKAAKPSPAEVRWMSQNVALAEISVLAVCYSCFCLLLSQVYMQKINSGTNARELEEPGYRRGKRSQSPSVEAGGLGRVIPHAPVTSQSWGRSHTQPQVQQTMCMLRGFHITVKQSYGKPWRSPI